jgi:hypothetical protein
MALKPSYSGQCPVCCGLPEYVKRCKLCHGKGRINVYGASTAIKRNRGSAPCRLLYEHNLIKGSVIDLGSGKNDDLHYLEKKVEHAAAFDPYHYFSRLPMVRTYDTVLCTYVFNVVPEEAESNILRTIRKLMTPGGRAFIAVRRDLPRCGKLGRGVWQRFVKLPLAIQHQDRNFAIYSMGG